MWSRPETPRTVTSGGAGKSPTRRQERGHGVRAILQFVRPTAPVDMVPTKHFRSSHGRVSCRSLLRQPNAGHTGNPSAPRARDRQGVPVPVARIERYIVACYDATERGHFRAHRDNTTKGTGHRRFAVTANLYDGCDGGELWFPHGWPAVSAEMTPDLSHSSGRSRAAARTHAGPPAGTAGGNGGLGGGDLSGARRRSRQAVPGLISGLVTPAKTERVAAPSLARRALP
jgi:hypothetical protein